MLIIFVLVMLKHCCLTFLISKVFAWLSKLASLFEPRIKSKKKEQQSFKI